MRLNVNPNRMELTRLKRRLATSKRGHKLLKDKQDELMRRFIELVRRNDALRREVEAELAEAFKDFALTGAETSPEFLEEAVMFPAERVSVEVSAQNVMSVIVPRMRFSAGGAGIGGAGMGGAGMGGAGVGGDGGAGAGFGAGAGPGPSSGPDASAPLLYGFANTSDELDQTLGKLRGILSKLLQLGEVEKICNLMAAEIEKTRRRVNALEYMTIPQLEETIKYIRMKLDENERGNLTRLMKFKSMMLELE